VLYEKAEAAVLVDGSLSRWIKMTAGNRQGDPISPNAFIGLLERIMDGVSEMEDKGVIVQGESIFNLKFADVDLIDKDPGVLQRMLDQLCVDSERFGMFINESKTKSLTFRRTAQTTEPTFNIHGNPIESVTSFIYLGSKISLNNHCSEDIRRRIQLSTVVHASFKTIWNDKSINIEVKIQLLVTCVFCSAICFRDMDNKEGR